VFPIARSRCWGRRQRARFFGSTRRIGGITADFQRGGVEVSRDEGAQNGIANMARAAPRMLWTRAGMARLGRGLIDADEALLEAQARRGDKQRGRPAGSAPSLTISASRAAVLGGP
jgi:hypothetical protein